MRDHVRILGILNIVMGCLTALIGVVVLIAMGGIAGVITASGASGDTENGAAAAPIIAVIGVCIAVFFILISLPSIIGGWGLLKFRPWARIVMIVVSVLHLINIPFGTAVGLYGLWVLLSDEGRRIFEGRGSSYIAPSYVPPSYVPPAPYPAQATPPADPSYPPQPPPGV